MTEQELLRLYGLRGTIQGLKTVAKCGIRSAHEAMKNDCSDWLLGYLEGLLTERVAQVRDYQYLYNEVTKAIKEVDNG